MLCTMLTLGLCSAARAQAPEPAVITPQATDAALLNPGMGIYVMVGNKEQPDPDLWFMKLCGVAYTRCHWSDLEPEQGVYTFDEYFGPMLDYWVGTLAKRIAFRVMCESMHGNTEYVTPKWVFDAGVTGVKHVGLRGQQQTDPIFWDPLYLDLQCQFIRALGQWADGRQGIEFVDIGSIGEWGEMHFGQHIAGRWTQEQLQETGFSEYKLALAYRRIIDAYADAFPHTRVFLNVGGRNGINDYAASRGLHFRQDGLGPNGASYNVESRLYPDYASKGVQCNLELIVGYDAMKERGWDPRDVLKKGLEAPLSYQNINFGGTRFLADPPPEVREAIEFCARHIGYRFVLQEARVPAQVHAWPDMPGRLPVQATWANEGVAPCYQDLAFEWTLVAPDGRAVAAQQEFPDTPTRRWAPGTSVVAGALLDLPQGLAAGTYMLTVRLFLPEKPETRYYLPLPEAAEDGTYRVGEIGVVKGQPGEQRAFGWDFEEGKGAASVAQGMTAEIASDPVHGGAKALKLSGHSAQTWGYGLIERVPLQPGARYRLSAWMLVRSTSRPDLEPTVKVGMNAADGKWITKANTGQYDTKALGTWQHLTVEFDCPILAATGDVSVERSSLEAPIDAELYLDDVELTVVAAP
jgi:hypothetical protein